MWKFLIKLTYFGVLCRFIWDKNESKFHKLKQSGWRPPTPFLKKNLMRGHIISPSIEHTLAAKLPPALWCLVVRHQAPLHSMLPLASEDVLHFSTPKEKKDQLLRCGISISTYLIVLKFIEVLTAEVSPLSWGQTSKNSFWPRRSDVPPTLNCFCPSAQSKL